MIIRGRKKRIKLQMNANQHYVSQCLIRRFAKTDGTIEKYNIKAENTYGSDEVGIQAQGGAEREYVFGPRTKAAPYQQRSGTRENITTIVTICADGTSTPPAVIFKGSAYQVKWGESNPLNASYVLQIFIPYTLVN